jgi:hypothetical protein
VAIFERHRAQIDSMVEHQTRMESNDVLRVLADDLEGHVGRQSTYAFLARLLAENALRLANMRLLALRLSLLSGERGFDRANANKDASAGQRQGQRPDGDQREEACGDFEEVCGKGFAHIEGLDDFVSAY